MEVGARKTSSFRLIDIGKIVNGLIVTSARTGHLDSSFKYQIFVLQVGVRYDDMTGNRGQDKTLDFSFLSSVYDLSRPTGLVNG